jgi:hypothetical protein
MARIVRKSRQKRWPIGAVCAAILVALVADSALAAERCKAKVDKKTGAIVISARNVGANPRWDVSPGIPGGIPFSNSDSCVAGTTVSDCALGAEGTLSSITPPAGCRIYISDDGGTECSVMPKGCVPGVRPTDDSFPENDPRRGAPAPTLECTTAHADELMTPSTPTYVTATCPDGYRVTGGGSAVGYPGFMAISVPLNDETGWLCGFFQDRFGINYGVECYARCCRVP